MDMFLKNKGFTLLELMISIAIVGMVLTAIYTSFITGSNVCTAGSERAQLLHTARMALNDMLSTIENLEYYGNGLPLQKDEEEDPDKPNEYSFFVSGKSDNIFECATKISPMLIDGAWISGEKRVSYRMFKDPKTNILKFQKLIAAIDDVNFEEPVILSLSENILDVVVQLYYDEKNFNDWDSEKDEGVLPEIMEINVEVPSGKNSKDNIILRSSVLLPTTRVDIKQELKNKRAQYSSGSETVENPEAPQN